MTCEVMRLIKRIYKKVTNTPCGKQNVEEMDQCLDDIVSWIERFMEENKDIRDK